MATTWNIETAVSKATGHRAALDEAEEEKNAPCSGPGRVLGREGTSRARDGLPGVCWRRRAWDGEERRGRRSGGWEQRAPRPWSRRWRAKGFGDATAVALVVVLDLWPSAWRNGFEPHVLDEDLGARVTSPETRPLESKLDRLSSSPNMTGLIVNLEYFTSWSDAWTLITVLRVMTTIPEFNRFK